jgi:hypothetical protein
MSHIGSIQNINIFVVFVSICILFSCVSFLSYKAGSKAKMKSSTALLETTSTNILGLLALILGFTFSMAISRYEAKRSLTVDEANAIGTAFLRAELIPFKNSAEVKSLFNKYIDLRIKAFKEEYPVKTLDETEQVQNQLWQKLIAITSKHNGALESAYTIALNQMFDSATTRNFSFKKMLPIPMYLLIILIAMVGLGSLNFDRGFHGDSAHWREALFILLLGIVLSTIVDIDHSRFGTVRISQDALYEVQKLIRRN